VISINFAHRLYLCVTYSFQNKHFKQFGR